MEQSEIQKWVERNAKHFARQDYPIGGFLSAVVRNDFSEACVLADDTNRRALILYAVFLHNEMPARWRDKALAKAEVK